MSYSYNLLKIIQSYLKMSLSLEKKNISNEKILKYF